MREEPEEQRESGAEDQAGDDGEVESGVFAAVDDIAREAAETKRKFTAEIEKGTNRDEESAENKESATEFAKSVHPGILPEAAERLFPPRTSVSYFLLVLTSR